jgi:hypothetical protein
MQIVQDNICKVYRNFMQTHKHTINSICVHNFFKSASKTWKTKNSRILKKTRKNAIYEKKMHKIRDKICNKNGEKTFTLCKISMNICKIIKSKWFKVFIILLLWLIDLCFCVLVDYSVRCCITKGSHKPLTETLRHMVTHHPNCSR